MAYKLTTCTFCGAGCGLYLETRGNRVVGVCPSRSHPANKGRICVRGWHIHEVTSSPDRLRKPLLRKNGRFEEVSSEEAVDFIVTRLNQILNKYGPESIALLSSPRCSNEEAYLLQKFGRAVIGTNNVDHGAGVYCNNSINVLLDMIGVPASTNSLSELAKSEVIIVDGVDLARQLPTIGGAVIRAKLNGAKLIVIDERHQRLVEQADLFLQIKPGAETLLYGAMEKVIVDRGLMNLPFIKARCGRYEGFVSRLRDYDLLAVAEECGVSAEQIEAAALAYGKAGRAAILFSTGIEARDAESIEAMLNLVLLTGHIGREGSGIFALTEHNNLQGVCDMGMLPDRLPGYHDVGNVPARREIEAVWGSKIPEGAGFSAGSLFTHCGYGKVRAVWLCRYDPVSTAFYGRASNLLEQCDLVVMQHIFLAETAKYAHVILPTTGFGEERATFTSTERRVQLAERVIDPPDGIIPAWRQLVQVARAMGAGWEYESSSDVMDEISAVVPFYSGVDYRNISRGYGRQWPCTKDNPLGTSLLFSETDSDAVFKFVPVARPRRVAVARQEYPLTLVFGHSLYYWHQNILVRQSETLKREYRILLLDYPEGFLEINTEDAKALGIRDGDRIRIRAEAGSAVTMARVTNEVQKGAVFVPYFVLQVREQIRGLQESGAQTAPVCVEKEPP